ncbi:MAG: isovaleryl-CoA dehydrogenase [Proteobacteria bacterium]|nr:isovaleryl-CoA dehydrogenase [Pseudomonadota bacterium]
MHYRHYHADLSTHKVLNQAPPLGDVNLYELDVPLKEAIQREGAGWSSQHLSDFGAKLGSVAVRELGGQANKYPPELRRYDRYGHRIDVVDFHPSYHQMFSLAKRYGVHSKSWTSVKEGGGHVVHSALEYLLGQVESGVCCPITMTSAAVPVLRRDPELAEEWVPKMLNEHYDPEHLPHTEKKGLTVGMAMTEKQGGSDLRANQTRAEKEMDGSYRLTGHKWFCSAPMSDAFLTLAQTDKGLTCFFVPRFLPDGKKNRLHIERLKDKLGNRSNASSEIEYVQTWAKRLGAEGRGVATIIDMVHHTRLDCALAAVGLMRQSLTQALHHTRHRKTFGQYLVDQPLMKNVLADLIVEYEAALMMGFRIARAYDEAQSSEEQAIFARLSVAVGKYWSNKRCSMFVNEAMECLGGAGYVEESMMPRLYREAPLNGIWEGSGNVICLDVLRTFHREPNAAQIFLAILDEKKGCDPRYDKALERTKELFLNTGDAVFLARKRVEQLALLFQGALLLGDGHPVVTDLFLETRLDFGGGCAFGTLPTTTGIDDLLSRHLWNEQTT